jgi:exopolysaccharide biosynthesis polyprenyl glycosylphosphotransferase
MNSNRFRSFSTLFLFFTDFVSGFVALIGAYFIRFHLLPVTEGYTPEEYYQFCTIGLIMWIVSRFWVGLHRSRARAFDGRTLTRIIKCSFLNVLLLMATASMIQFEYARKIPPILFVNGVVLLIITRIIADQLLHRLQTRKGWGVERIALLGISPVGKMTAEKILGNKSLGRQLVGFIAARRDAKSDPDLMLGLPLVGNLLDLEDVIAENNIDEVLVTDPAMSPEEVLNLLLELEKMCVRARVVPNVLETMLSESQVDNMAGIPLLGLPESRLKGGNLALKWAFDVITTSTGLIFLSIPMLIIAILVKITSRGPLFYKQERVGLDGQRFNIYKFRSMVVDAEAESGPVMTKPGDARVTPIGGFLRRWNLDELPQLFNVLAGHMSLVGPRPERPYFVEKFKEQIPRYMARHKVKAGITGWAQVNGLRGDTSISERLQYDLFYMKHWSLWLDIKILLMTFTARENAY